MTEFTLCYREVVPDQPLHEYWKDVSLTTGGTQSTLQDIKVREKASGYSFQDSTKHYTRNRFIYWKIRYDVLELVEQSLDINLSDNRVRYYFYESPILDGISVWETAESVVILVPTVCSVHRLSFPHPSKFHKQDELLGSHPNLAAPSIFSKADTEEAKNRNKYHLFSTPGTTVGHLPRLASSYYNSHTDDAIFVLVYPGSEMLLIKQKSAGPCVSFELKSDSLLPRFLAGLTEKFRGKNLDLELVLSVLIHTIDDEPCVLSLNRGGQLKVWSCLRGQCLTAVDLLAETGYTEGERPQEGIIKRPVDDQDSDCPLAIYMNFSSGGQFHIFRLSSSAGQEIRITKLNTLIAVENGLIDFCLQTDRLWSIWRASDDDCVIYKTSLTSDCWTPVLKEVLVDTDRPMTTKESDPREVYLQYLFRPGRFPLHVISKSLKIYNKSSVIKTEVNMTSVAALKQSICLAIESDIRNSFKDHEISEEEYLEYALWCWQRFYSCCVQYHQESFRPLGLMLLPQVSGAVLLKKSTIAFLRPVEPLEHMMLSGDLSYRDQFVNFSMLGEDEDTALDVMTLFDVMTYVDRQLSDSFKNSFETALAVRLAPNDVMADLVGKLKNEMKSEYKTISDRVCTLLSQCADLYRAVHKVLELLRHNSGLSHPDSSVNPAAMYYFSSSLGVSLVASCLRQQAQNRFAICRDLLLICDILIKGKELQPNIFEAIQSVCKPEIGILTQANYVVLWLTGLPVLNNTLSETSLQRLTPIRLTPSYNKRSNGSCISLIELFAASTGGHEARKKFARVEFNGAAMAHWHLSLLPLVNHLRSVLWPLKSGTVLAEWVISSGQHVWLQEYVRILNGWCDCNTATHRFLLALSFLSSTENYKALDLFQFAAEGVLDEPFFHQRVLKDQPVDRDCARISYYLKVIQLFELHRARDCAISVADLALGVINPENPLLATLYSIKFKHHLALKRYGDAFYALKSNPEDERKKDNLRDLVKTLLDEKNFDTVLSFTYGELDELFTSILLTRARATDPVSNVFYEILYAYQIKQGSLCHRLAASIMYEQAYRLSHLNTVDAIEKQVKCLLAAKNILQLCDGRYAWVVRPCDPDEQQEEVTLDPLAGSGNEGEVFLVKNQVEVVNVDLIKRELSFASAKLHLAKFDASPMSNVTAPIELVTLLSSAGLFKTALNICKTFGLPQAPVFEALTWRCVILSEEENPVAWEWLVENDLQDLPPNRDSVAMVVWQLLQDYLAKYEQPNATTLHKVVCKKIISMRIYVPFWLLASYKLRNPGELLRILHVSGRLDEAFEVAHGYLLAALGYGKELFGFVKPLAPTSEPFCLPVYSLEAFITELEMQNAKSIENPFRDEHKTLSELFARYLETATRITNEKCQLVMSSYGSIPTASHKMVF
ncbi:nuclear pore complex protein Nup160 homolog isoform X2 [Cylas formicarius]|uniref:nuclear pore complex protein Nup160 homolog isoform X2 n=1 Tax=Cylas formicarius TaxID=197179 RepID=UPI00295831DB|nr:nuclear pore complex protein Nup160 homolog isoform X2 [Cylas formicarius]